MRSDDKMLVRRHCVKTGLRFDDLTYQSWKARRQFSHKRCFIRAVNHAINCLRSAFNIASMNRCLNSTRWTIDRGKSVAGAAIFERFRKEHRKVLGRKGSDPGDRLDPEHHLACNAQGHDLLKSFWCPRSGSNHEMVGLVDRSVRSYLDAIWIETSNGASAPQIATPLRLGRSDKRRVTQE